jgi:predicted nucleic acid-binding protein
MILVDTGPLVAAANRTDAHHAESVEALATAKPPRLVPGLVIAEVSYLLARDAGSAVEAEFLRSFTTGFLSVGPSLDVDPHVRLLRSELTWSDRGITSTAHPRFLHQLGPGGSEANGQLRRGWPLPVYGR